MTSKEILDEIAKKLAISKDDCGSMYIDIIANNSVIRFANHKTHMDTWESRYAMHEFPKHMISIVFEDVPTKSSDTIT